MENLSPTKQEWEAEDHTICAAASATAAIHIEFEIPSAIANIATLTTGNMSLTNIGTVKNEVMSRSYVRYEVSGAGGSADQ